MPLLENRTKNEDIKKNVEEKKNEKNDNSVIPPFAMIKNDRPLKFLKYDL